MIKFDPHHAFEGYQVGVKALPVQANGGFEAKIRVQVHLYNRYKMTHRYDPDIDLYVIKGCEFDGTNLNLLEGHLQGQKVT